MPPSTAPVFLMGFDMGSTQCCLASSLQLFSESTPPTPIQIIPNEYHQLTTPSLIYFPDPIDAPPLIGQSARKHLLVEPSRCVFDLKRILGRDPSDAFLRSNQSFYPFELLVQDGQVYLHVDNRVDSFAPELLTSFLAGTMDAFMMMHYQEQQQEQQEEQEEQKDFSESCHRFVVLTHPIFFNEPQKQALKEACEFIGWSVLDVVAESHAVCVSCDLHRMVHNDHVMVVHLGGTSFCVTLEYISEDGRIETRGFEGDLYLVSMSC